MFIRVRSRAGAAPSATSLRCVVDRGGRGPSAHRRGATRGGAVAGSFPPRPRQRGDAPRYVPSESGPKRL